LFFNSLILKPVYLAFFILKGKIFSVLFEAFVALILVAKKIFKGNNNFQCFEVSNNHQ